MWTKENRRRYDRSSLRYQHDPTDEEWAEIWPTMAEQYDGQTDLGGRDHEHGEGDPVIIRKWK